MTDHFALAPLGALDLDRAAALHAESFAALGERAWTRQDIAELVASPGVAGLLLQIDGHDAGFALCRVAADEAELLTIAVRPARRRRGVAHMIDDGGARTLFLEVGVDNLAARNLYDAQGFCAVGARRAYYQRGKEPAADGIVMRLTLI
jgi:[ribosomal protein S18]-alanine N-acetyltransferase